MNVYAIKITPNICSNVKYNAISVTQQNKIKFYLLDSFEMFTFSSILPSSFNYFKKVANPSFYEILYKDTQTIKQENQEESSSFFKVGMDLLNDIFLSPFKHNLD